MRRPKIDAYQVVTTSELLDLCERLDAFADDPKLVTIGIVASAIHRATAALRESMRERDEAMNELVRLNHWQENFLCETQQKLDKAREHCALAEKDAKDAARYRYVRLCARKNVHIIDETKFCSWNITPADPHHFINVSREFDAAVDTCLTAQVTEK